jgi:hypothetical protein
MTDSPLTLYARRQAIRARRLRVIEALMDGATGVRLATLVACWCRECGR